MGVSDRQAKTLGELGDRIDAARAAHRPKRSNVGDKYKAGSVAWRMVTELVVGVMVGGAMGWGLDSLFGTLPVFLIVMGILGFAAGIRTMMRSAEEIRRQGLAEAKGGATGPDRARSDGTGGARTERKG
ncbi:MAG: AtpZ/AtpI family protein [Pseudomonadota bacterium]